MAVLQTGQSFSSGDQVTATKLQDIANLATFRTGANQTADDSTIQVDGSGGYLKVKSGGISSNELATDSVITAKIQDDAVTSDKLAHISNLNVLGNVSGSTAAPVGVEIKDEDNMASDSATALATQQSIKAYVDTELTNIVNKYSSSWTNSLTNGGTYTFTHNLGTDELVITAYMATSSAGANIKQIVMDTNDAAGSSDFARGGIITNVSSTTLELQLGALGWTYFNSSGSKASGNWGTTYTHIKIVAIG